MNIVNVIFYTIASKNRIPPDTAAKYPITLFIEFCHEILAIH